MKIWCISDTHGKEKELIIPADVDMVIHAGDWGTYREATMSEGDERLFLEWYKDLPIKHKILICGNHNTAFEKGFIKQEEIHESIVFLHHEAKVIEGIKIFGSPYTPTFGVGWAYNVKRDKLHNYWQEIPEDTDILITHGPPRGILDHTESGSRGYVTETGNKVVISCGDLSLLKRVRVVKPKLHIFGHIHPEEVCLNSAIIQQSGFRTRFINAAVLNLKYDIDNHGHIIEI